MSSIEKAQIKIGTAHEIGIRMDDALDAAKNDVYRCDGAVIAAVRIGADLESMVGAVQRDIDEGRIDMDQGRLVLEWLKRTRAVASDHAVRSTGAKTMAQGRVTGLEQAVAVVGQAKTEEENKVRAILAAAAAAGVEPEDLAPAPTIKQQRAAEDLVSAVPPSPPPDDTTDDGAKKSVKRAKNTR